MEDSDFLKLINITKIKNILIDEPQLSIIFEVLVYYIDSIIKKNNKYKLSEYNLNKLTSKLNNEKYELLNKQNELNKKNNYLKQKERNLNNLQKELLNKQDSFINKK